MKPTVAPFASTAVRPELAVGGPVDKREAIMQAALELFAERGFHGTAVPLIAKRAGVGAGTIYRYFEHKEALANALYQHWKRQAAERLLIDFPAEAPPRQQFSALFQGAMRLAMEHPVAMAFLELHHHAAYLDDDSRRASDRLRGAVRMMVDAWGMQSVTKAMPSDALIALVLGAMSGLMKDAWEGLVVFTPELAVAAEAACWDLIRR